VDFKCTRRLSRNCASLVIFLVFVPICFTPIIVFNNVDPMHVFFYLTIPQFILDIKSVTDFILPAIRLGGIYMGAADGCRIMCFTTIVLFCVLKHVDNNINLLITRCKHISQEFICISHILSYIRLGLLVSVTDCFLSLIIVFLISASTVLIVLTSYKSILSCANALVFQFSRGCSNFAVGYSGTNNIWDFMV